MHSEFTRISLDRLRYGLVWEDHRTLYRALALGADDHALVISSAGCNALNALLAGPRQVTAIDLNPVQNQLLGLKMHVIAHHPPAVLRGLLGHLPGAAPRRPAAGRATRRVRHGLFAHAAGRPAGPPAPPTHLRRGGGASGVF